MRACWLGISVLVGIGACTSADRDFASGKGEGGADANADTGQSGAGADTGAGAGGAGASDHGEASPAAGQGGDSEPGSRASQGGEGGTGASTSVEDPSAGAGGESLGPSCGDGNVDADEECDDGSNNGAGKACNADCDLNVCGDGDPGPEEGCDDGSENGLELLRCAPDCSRIIEIKHIVVADSQLPNSRLQPDPVATADATCPTGYKAFFAYGTARRATTTAFKAKNPIDWVIRPYTYYYNDHENPVWLTDAVPLLGVRNGAFMDLQNAIASETLVILTGLNENYTTLGSDNCDGWSSIQTSYSKRYGFPLATDAAFMHSSDLIECASYSISFYCVEQ